MTDYGDDKSVGLSAYLDKIIARKDNKTFATMDDILESNIAEIDESGESEDDGEEY